LELILVTHAVPVVTANTVQRRAEPAACVKGYCTQSKALSQPHDGGYNLSALALQSQVAVRASVWISRPCDKAVKQLEGPVVAGGGQHEDASTCTEGRMVVAGIIKAIGGAI
jgi:hypothetical protein